jgi:hypothetical protein
MELLSTSIVSPNPAVCSRDITMHLVLSAFTSNPISCPEYEVINLIALFFILWIEGTEERKEGRKMTYKEIFKKHGGFGLDLLRSEYGPVMKSD